MSKKRSAATKKSRPAPKSKGGAKKSSRGALAAAANPRTPMRKRIAALTSLPLAEADSGEQFETLMNLLRDRSQPIQVRLKALQALGAARFASPDFASSQGDYIATLRDVATDPNPELRQRVLGILAREKDGFAQKKLLEGLHNPEKALLPPEKALQLLGYDVHAEAYPIAREIVRNPPNTAAKREALRLLAADAASAATFERILRDKKETPEIRQISAAALHAVKPESLQKHAREIVLDPSEDDYLHDTGLTALTQFGGSAITQDKALMDRVDQLSTKGSQEVKNTARRFLGKYRE